MSEQFTLNKKDRGEILVALIYSGLSAMVVSALDLLPHIDVPLKYAWLVPIVNVILVALKKYLEDNPFDE